MLTSLWRNACALAAQHPRKLLLTDAAGAAFSALMLGIVLVSFQPYFGIPVHILYLLAALPIGFLAFDLICVFWIAALSGQIFKIIGWLNSAYCLLSISLLILHIDQITALGLLYVIGEIIIVSLISLIEINVSKNI